MINTEGIVLHLLLKEQSLDAFSALKSCFFSPTYSSIFVDISSYYTKQGTVPSFDEIKLITRNRQHAIALEALEILEVPNVSLDLAVDALIDQYAQTETLILIDGFVDEITMLDVNEVKEGLGSLSLQLDSKLNTDEVILTADKLRIFRDEEDTSKLKVPLGLSNWFDSNIGSLMLEDLILIGGKRGSGKSIICSNIAASQYELGNVVPYFTIEMTGDETFQRIMAVLSKVPHKAIRNNTTSPEQNVKLAKVRAGMFIDADDLYHRMVKGELKPTEFERELVATKELKPDNQIIIVDDREMSITQIDLSVQKLKAKHGDKLQIALVDYVNQVTLSGSADSMFDWTDQLAVSKQLKTLARKHKIVMASPYQIDESGGTRFSKGILDACDLALILDSKATPGHMDYECVKARSSEDDFKFRTAIEWECLRIDPAEIEMVSAEEGEEPDKPYSTKAILNGKDDL